MKKILVVDDNKNIADLTEIILSSAGYSCTKLNDGKSCLAAIRGSGNNNNDGEGDGGNGNSDGKSCYDLVLLDVAMPGFSGLDVLDALKQEGYLERNRVAFFTASSVTNMEVADFEKMGAVGCLKKPFTKAELLNFVDKHTSSYTALPSPPHQQE